MELIAENIINRVKNLPAEKRTLLTQRLAGLQKESADGTTAKRETLAAFVVAEEGRTLEVDDLRDFIFDKLPDYMLPASITVLECMPQTPNGKVDRKKLAEIAPENVETIEYVAPRNAVEEVLQHIWQDVLEIENIGVNDNFFQLGGHSLLVTILISKIREIFQTDISLRSIFDAPVISDLSKLLLQKPAQRNMIEKAAQLYLRLAALSEEEVDEMLMGESGEVDS